MGIDCFWQVSDWRQGIYSSSKRSELWNRFILSNPSKLTNKSDTEVFLAVFRRTAYFTRMSRAVLVEKGVAVQDNDIYETEHYGLVVVLQSSVLNAEGCCTLNMSMPPMPWL